MRMYFNHDVAWEQLKRHGIVYTLRGPGPTPYEVIVRIFRHGKDTGIRAVRQFVREVLFDPVYDKLMEKYVPLSGFGSLQEWMDAALEMSGDQPVWRLFEVKVIGELSENE